MQIKISKTGFLFVFFNMIILIPLLFLENADLNWLFSVAASIQLFFAVYLLRKSGYRMDSLPVLFIILSTVFHFGEALLLALGRNDLFDYTNIELAGSIEKYNQANIFALLVQALTVAGMMMAKEKVYRSRFFPRESVDKRVLFSMGVILFLIGVVPTAMYYSQMVNIILNGGVYAGVREAVNLGPIQLLSITFQPGILLMLFGSKENISRARFILCAAILFQIYCMLSGNRSEQLIYIVIYLLVYYRVIGQITVKKIVLFSGLAYVGIAALYFISAVRNFRVANMTNINARFVGVLTGEPVANLLAQLGSNLNVVALALKSIPDYQNFNSGFTYVVSMFSIYPNTGGLLGNIPNMYVFLNYLDTNLPLGGSYIGELYFNFGWLGLIGGAAIGMFIGKIGRCIEGLFIDENYIALTPYIILFGKLLWWVRDYFFCWIYSFFWTSILLFLFYRLMGRKNSIFRMAK